MATVVEKAPIDGDVDVLLQAAENGNKGKVDGTKGPQKLEEKKTNEVFNNAIVFALAAFAAVGVIATADYFGARDVIMLAGNKIAGIAKPVYNLGMEKLVKPCMSLASTGISKLTSLDISATANSVLKTLKLA